MPCNTRVRTTQVNLGKVNLDRLATMLVEAGWESYRGGAIVNGYSHGRYFDVQIDADTELFARKDGVGLRIKGGKAELYTKRPGTDLDKVRMGIVQGYAQRTAVEVAKRFGFKVQAQSTLENGAKRLVLGR